MDLPSVSAETDTVLRALSLMIGLALGTALDLHFRWTAHLRDRVRHLEAELARLQAW